MRPDRPDEAHVPDMSSDHARALLEVSPGADADEIKRAYRRMARDHHPDAGGDPDVFVALRHAYEQLLAQPPPPARVQRGRPSRAAAPATTSAARERWDSDGSQVDWDAGELTPGDRLDPDRLAVRLARRPGDIVAATSRAPGSALNRMAVHLAGDLSARLRIGPGTDDRGAPVVGVEIRAGTRRARRALEAAPLDGVWLRRRNPSTTTLVTSLTPLDDTARTAARTVGRTTRLLDAIGWGLASWRMLEPGSESSG